MSGDTTTVVTLEPFSIVYVPVGGAVMRPYERRRQGELAGTVGSRTPSFPIQRDVELSAYYARPGLQTPIPFTGDRLSFAEQADATVRVPVRVWEDILLELTNAALTPPASGAVGAPAAATTTAAPLRESVRRPDAPAGIWFEFQGTRWYSAGAAVVYDARRFEPAGDYRGFPVYRDRLAADGCLCLTTVPDGPLAPFAPR